MSDVASHNVRRDATDVRFGMRSMLIAMAVVAAVCTALGAFLRQFPAEAQPRLIAYWGILLVLFAALFVLNARRRYAAEKKAGEVLFQLVPHSYFFPHAPRFATILVGSVLLAFAPAMWAFGSFLIAIDNSALWWQLFNWQSFYAVFASGVGITYLWWHRRVRLSEHGLVIRHNFLPWEDLRRWYWDACHRGVIVMEFQRFNRIAAKVPEDERGRVEILLTQKS